MEAEGNDRPTLPPPSTLFLAGVGAQLDRLSGGSRGGRGPFFTINAWGIVVPVALLSPVWIFGIVRTGSFGLSTRFRSSDNADHQELKD